MIRQHGRVDAAAVRAVLIRTARGVCRARAPRLASVVRVTARVVAETSVVRDLCGGPVSQEVLVDLSARAILLAAGDAWTCWTARTERPGLLARLDELRGRMGWTQATMRAHLELAEHAAPVVIAWAQMHRTTGASP
ncbi:MAG: hypothetical protein KF847_19825 [Pirellulales bacterium]|nr:hypothetical protein [Pirellulales bacterium]